MEGSVIELTEVPGIVAQAYRLTEVPGGYKKCGTRTPVLWHGVYRTLRSSGYGYVSPTELTEVLGTGLKDFRD